MWTVEADPSFARVQPKDLILETGRLFLRNLAFSCSDTDLTTLMAPFGPVSSVSYPLPPSVASLVSEPFPARRVLTFIPLFRYPPSPSPPSQNKPQKKKRKKKKKKHRNIVQIVM